MLIVSICGVVLFVFYILFSSKIKCSKYTEYLIFFMFSFVLAVIAYHAQPMWDLSIHFSYMKMIEESKVGYLQLLTKGFYQYSHNRFYLLFNLLCFLSVKLENYHLMPFIVVLIDYLIIGYISVDWSRHYKVLFNIYLPSQLLTWMLMPYMHAVAGMRNANAACLAALALYLYLEKKKSILLSLSILLAALFMHPAIIAVVPFMILSRYRLNWRQLTMVVAVVIGIKQMAVVFSLSTNEFLHLIGRLYLQYSSNAQYRNSRRYLYADLLFIAIYLLIMFVNRKKRKPYKQLENFFILYMLYICGNIGNYDLVIRPMYVLAPLSVPLMYSVFAESWIFTDKYTTFLKFIIISGLSIINIWVIQDYLKILMSQYF